MLLRLIADDDRCFCVLLQMVIIITALLFKGQEAF